MQNKNMMRGMGETVFVISTLAFIIGAVLLFGWLFTLPTPPEPPKNEIEQTNDIQKGLVTAVPVPDIQTSSERANVAKRAEIFNQEGKISYIYLISYGKVMAFYPVSGKVSSLRSYMTPVERLVTNSGEPCSTWNSSGTCYVVEAPDIDGTYGENVEGIFFFTTDGAYVEWKGEYMMSDQPLKLATPPALIREI